MVDEDLVEERVYEEMAPLVGYTVATQNSLIKLHSLRFDKTIHVFRFTSSVAKFQSTDSTNQMIVLL